MEGVIAVTKCITVFAGLIALAWLYFHIRWRLEFPKQTPAEIQQERERYLNRLLNPDFAALEKHFGHTLPKALKQLYANRAELERCVFYVAPKSDSSPEVWHYVVEYTPLDMEAQRHSFHNTDDYLEFANEDGNAYIIDPRQDDPPVLQHDHETNEIEQVCESLSEFLSWPRFQKEYNESGGDNYPCVLEST